MSLENLPHSGRYTREGLTEIVQIFGLADRLGLADTTDKALLVLTLFARLRRNPSSERAELLKHPMIPFLKSWPLMGHVIPALEASEEKHQEAVKKTELELQEFIEGHYLSPEAHQHAQTIVSAVNMLVAQWLARGGNSYRGGNLFRKGRPVLMIDKQELDKWGEFWKPRISPL